MKEKILRWIIFVLAALIFVVSLYAYPRLPAQIASHWNAQGEVNGTMSRFWGVFLLPIVTVGILGLLWLIPYIDPLRENIAKFRTMYDGFIVVFLLYMLVIQGQIILWSLGTRISPNVTLPVILGVLFVYIGFLLEKTRQNWFIGIRTPWTLSSQTVWDKTHRVAAKWFKVAGLIAMLGVFWSRYAIWFMIVPIVAVALYAVIYSYIAYHKLETEHR